MAKNKKAEAANIANDANAEAKPVPTNRMVTAAMVRVRAVGHIGEDGRHYNPGDEFETTAARAAALGGLVKRC
jgi:hypothetical protein